MMPLAAATVIALLVGHVASVHADPATARAKALFKKAELHFSLGEFQKALGLYRDAYQQRQLPGLLFNIGQCHRNMKRCDRALFFYKQYLVRKPDAANREAVLKLITLCEAQARATEPASRPAPDRATKPAQPVTRPAAPPASRRAAPARVEPTTTAPRAGPSRAWFWASASLAGVLLAGGAATGAVALSKSSQYKDEATPLSRREELKDDGETLATVSVATIIAGAAMALGSGALFFLSTPGEQDAGRDGSWKRTTGLVCVGVGLSTLGASLALGSMVSDRVQTYEAAAEAGRTFQDLQRHRDTGQQLEAAHVATGIAGGVLTAAGFALLTWYWIGAGDSGRGAVSVSPVVTGGRYGLTAAFEF
jgi:hypothetical protein